MVHGGHGSPESPAADVPVRNPIIERISPLILHLAYEVDPWVRVSLTPYHWRGEDLLDIGLAWQGHEHHLQVSAARLELIEADPHMLEHDIAGAVGDMKREAGAHPPAPAPGGEEGVDHEHGPGHVHLNRRQRRAQLRAQAEAQAAPPPPPPPPPVPAPFILAPNAQPAHDEGATRHVHLSRGTANPPPAESHGTDRHGGPGHTATLEPDAPPALTEADQHVYASLTALVRDIVHHLDPEAAVTFAVYEWHGSPTVDVAIDRHGHVSHYEVTLERAALFLDDHHMLEHDLEGVVGH